MVISRLLGKLHYGSILRRNYLLLHAIGYRLVSMISDLRIVLHAVGGYAPDASGVYPIRSVCKVINRPKQMKITISNILYYVTYLGLLMFLGDSVYPCICILYCGWPFDDPLLVL